MKIFRLLPVLFILVLAAACAKEKPATPAVINPNGDSELALLMRAMFDDGMEVRTALLEDKHRKIKCDYKSIHTAIPTETQKIDSVTFNPFARAYVEAVEAYNEATRDQRVSTYLHMVNTCVQCHQSYCTGPLRKIKKLQLSEIEMAQLVGERF